LIVTEDNSKYLKVAGGVERSLQGSHRRSAVFSSSSRRSGLRSATTAQYVKPRLKTVFSERAFSFAGTNVCM